MARLVLLIVVATAIAAAAGWFATEPGSAVITLRGWRVETSAGMAALAVGLFALAAVLLYGAASWLLGAPGRIRRWREARRARQGLDALARGMVAVAAGDARGARRAARQAESSLDSVPLTMLLQAQTAQLEGDDGAAETYFKAMLGRPETEFLGLRGLLVQAGRAGDAPRALAYAERAAKLRPDSPWVQESLFDLSVKAGLWKEAEAALKKAVANGAFSRAEGEHHRAAVLLQQAADAEARGFATEALNLARAANKAAPGFVPAALALSGHELKADRPRHARRALERAWAETPHPDLAAAYGEFADGVGEARALNRVRLVERLVRDDPGRPEARLAYAEAALEARLWGEARAQLTRAEERFESEAKAAPARLYRLWAALEEKEHGDQAAAARWLARAGEAAPDARWVCGACGAGFASWSALCPECQGFDTLSWRTPDTFAVIAPAERTIGGFVPGPARAAIGTGEGATHGHGAPPPSPGAGAAGEAPDAAEAPGGPAPAAPHTGPEDSPKDKD